MKKALKWTLIVVGAMFIVIVAIAIIIPIVFKDDIKKAIDDQLATSLNADVVFDVAKFNLTLFKNFPNLTAEIQDLGVLNREPFAGDVLFAVEKFDVDVNLKDILFGNQLRIKGITMVRPVIHIKVLSDGRANYDIAVPSTDSIATTVEPSNFSFGIDHWEIIDGHVTYDDKSLPFFLSLKGFNHTGSGDFTQDEFDLTTHTVVDSLTTSYDGTEYLSNKRTEMDMVISISEEYTKFTFKENSAKINDFAMSFDGSFKMNEKDYGMDISFKSPENSFKSLLSIVPGMYTQSFANIETKGDLAFNGFVKGTYSDTQMPAFNVELKVIEAMFKYPDLPTAINNINVDLWIDNKDGIIDNTIIDLKKMHFDFGTNPVDAHARITKMYPTQVDANITAKLNLAELSKMFPMEGLEMKGNYAINLAAKGVYDSLKKSIPSIDATMSLANGYVKSSDFPLPLQDLAFHSTIKNSSGKMAETFIVVKNLSMMLDNEKFTADLLLENLDDYTWDLKARGGVDIEKMTKIFPLEGMTLSGKVKADLETKGKYSDLEAERYDQLPTSGTASLQDFTYKASDLPYVVAISQASMVFDPKKIDLQKMEGTIGKSDFRVNGSVFNYLGYALGQNDNIKGTVNFNSTMLDLNEFMTDTEEATTADSTSYGVIPVPKGIDFVLKSSIKTVKMMDMSMTNASGDVIVKDGIANLNGLKFNMLGGSFSVSGTYNTSDLAHPKYDLALKIDNASINETAQTSSIVQSYAPIAGLMTGNYSTNFKLSGELLQNMMPNLSSVNMGGLFKIEQAALKDSKLVSGITSLTKLDNTTEVTLKDVILSAAITDGKLITKPFDVKFGEYTTNISGSTSLDGSLDYKLIMDVPAGKLGAQYNSFISQYSGAKNDPNAKIPVTIGLGGNYKNPSAKLLMDNQKKQAEQAVTNAAKEEGTKAIENAVKGTAAEKVIDDLLGTSKKDSVKSDTTKTGELTAEEIQKKAADEAKKKVQNFLKKKKN